MARMLSCKLLMATVMAIGLGFNSMTAQEADRPNCEAKKCDESQAGIEFAFPGVSLKFKIATDDETQANDCPKCAARYADIPFLSNLKYADRLFKNVGLDDVRKKTKGVDVGKIRIQANCEDGPACSDASSACCEECPPCCDVSSACCDDGCPEIRAACGKCCDGCQVSTPACCDESSCCPTHQLAMLPKLKFVETFTFRGKPNMAPVDQREQMFQLRTENELLKMQVATMNERMEWVSEMAELRAHNQVLEARLEMHEKRGRPTHTNRAIPKCSCCPPSTAVRPPHSFEWVPAVAHPSVPPQAFPARCLPPQPPVVKSPPLPKASFVLPTINRTIVVPHPPVQPMQTRKPKAKKEPTKPANPISVPDGGTIIFGGGIKHKMQAVPTPTIVARTASFVSPPAPVRPKLNQATIDRMEKQIEKLQSELKQLKSQQPLAPIKAVPIKGKFKSFQPAEPPKDSSSQSDQQTFSFYLGTLR